ncbi:protein-L-isoaspartate O-methyltransferase [Streptacidiphilus sp. BW17]|uniref:methyltransferase domain-containing protein n=1 Tax=Streptacidiphilus sp. BW17 TaxID=3156274 RepID=UPI003518D947
MTDTIERDAERLRAALVDQLTACGALTSPTWRSAFGQVPRHHFVPVYYRQGITGVGLYEPGTPGWLAGAYVNEPLVTQMTGGVPTSSSTGPSLMAKMLEALYFTDGMRVLEVGTGTGYNAALLSTRLGSKNVATVDVDPALTSPAEQRLNALDLTPTVVTGDGAGGHPAGAPYDRIIATCAVRSIPLAWLEQLTPDGWAMATLVNGLHGYALARVDQDGHGRILDIESSFMPMRSHADPAFATLKMQAGPPVMVGTTSEPVINDKERFALGLALPEVVVFGLPDGRTPGSYLAHRSDGSWAHALADGALSQGGPQRLWDQLTKAREAYRAAGSPRPDQFEVLVDGRLQRVRHGQLVYELPGFVRQ